MQQHVITYKYYKCITLTSMLASGLTQIASLAMGPSKQISLITASSPDAPLMMAQTLVHVDSRINLAPRSSWGGSAQIKNIELIEHGNHKSAVTYVNELTSIIAKSHPRLKTAYSNCRNQQSSNNGSSTSWHCQAVASLIQWNTIYKVPIDS